MKLRLKGESEWKDYKLYFNENGSLMGVVYDEIKVKRPLACMNDKDEVIEFTEPMLLPLECFDMWEEPNLQQVRTQAAIAAMQAIIGLQNPKSCANFDRIADFAIQSADALVKRLRN